MTPFLTPLCHPSFRSQEVEEDVLRAVLRAVCVDAGLPGDGPGAAGHLPGRLGERDGDQRAGGHGQRGGAGRAAQLPHLVAGGRLGAPLAAQAPAQRRRQHAQAQERGLHEGEAGATNTHTYTHTDTQTHTHIHTYININSMHKLKSEGFMKVRRHSLDTVYAHLQYILYTEIIYIQGFSWVKMGLRCSKKKCARCARSLCYHVTLLAYILPFHK